MKYIPFGMNVENIRSEIRSRVCQLRLFRLRSLWISCCVIVPHIATFRSCLLMHFTTSSHISSSFTSCRQTETDHSAVQNGQQLRMFNTTHAHSHLFGTEGKGHLDPLLCGCMSLNAVWQNLLNSTSNCQGYCLKCSKQRFHEGAPHLFHHCLRHIFHYLFYCFLHLLHLFHHCC